jgi:hypothetical protein
MILPFLHQFSLGLNTEFKSLTKSKEASFSITFISREKKSK